MKAANGGQGSFGRRAAPAYAARGAVHSARHVGGGPAHACARLPRPPLLCARCPAGRAGYPTNGNGFVVKPISSLLSIAESNKRLVGRPRMLSPCTGSQLGVLQQGPGAATAAACCSPPRCAQLPGWTDQQIQDTFTAVEDWLTNCPSATGQQGINCMAVENGCKPG